MTCDILTADNLAALSSIRHAFFTRHWGNPSLSYDAGKGKALGVRTKMAVQMGAQPDHLLCVHQIHSTEVVTVADLWQALGNPHADAMVTDRPGIVLGVQTADCVPVLFADAKTGVIGAAHAGWRGAIGGILENTLEAMEKLGARRHNIEAALGPCIWQDSYEVGPEFPAVFLTENPKNQSYFKPAFKSGHYQFDLPGYVINKLHELKLSSVEKSLADTCAAPERFFSHRYSTLRKEPREGNLMSAIMLVAR